MATALTIPTRIIATTTSMTVKPDWRLELIFLLSDLYRCSYIKPGACCNQLSRSAACMMPALNATRQVSGIPALCVVGTNHKLFRPMVWRQPVSYVLQYRRCNTCESVLQGSKRVETFQFSCPWHINYRPIKVASLCCINVYASRL